MGLALKWRGAFVLCLIVGLALLGCPRVGNAAGAWEVISLPQQPGEVLALHGLAVDGAGSLYVAEEVGNGEGRIEQRDAQGHWSLLAGPGSDLGQVDFDAASYPDAPLAVDAGGSLYVADSGWRIQNRDAQGHWSLLADAGSDLGQVDFDFFNLGGALAVDAVGSLYVAETHWDYVNQTSYSRLQQRDGLGHWSLLAGPDQVWHPRALVVDTAGNLYVAEGDGSSSDRLLKRDAQGHWTLLADSGDALGQVDGPLALAVNTAGSLYVVDQRGANRRIQKYTPGP